MNYVPVIIFSKGIPDGIKKLIRKQMHMEIDYFVGKIYHKQCRLVHLLGDDSVYYINFVVLSNNWNCAAVVSVQVVAGWVYMKRVNGLNFILPSRGEEHIPLDGNF